MAGNGLKHLTNLESEDRVVSDLAKAQDLVAKTDPANEQAYRQADAAYIQAKLRADNWKDTHAILAKEYGTLRVDRPKATKWRSVKQLETLGLVGIYVQE